jgi:hypothetical protein
MSPYIVLAQLFADANRPRLADSALPNAPVQPLDRPRRRARTRNPARGG